MYEVRFHGRGGQGAVMAAQALASAAVYEGKHASAFPHFGAERRGAPVLAFTRVDNKKIRKKTRVYEPDYVVVLDSQLINLVNVAEGLKDNGMLIINTLKKPEEIDIGKVVKTGTVDATGVALEVLGRDITNSAILGAFAKTTGLVSIEAVKEGIMDIFGNRIGEKAALLNAKAAELSYERTVVGFCKGEKKVESKKMWLPTYKELPLGAAIGKEVKTEAGLVGLGSFVENKTGSWRTFKPIMDHEKCIRCLFCWFYCPEGAIEHTEDTKNQLKINYDYCKGCGICASECPVDAISWGEVRG